MRYFFIVFTFFIFAFANAFYALNGAHAGYSDQLLYVFNITIRKAEMVNLEDGYYVLLWALFIVSMCFFTYIILNMTIGMVKMFLD